MAEQQPETERESSQSTGGEPIGVTSGSLALLLAALWGGTPVAVSYSVDTLPPVATAAIRFTLAALFLLVWAGIEGVDLRLRSEQVRPAVITGVLLFVQIGTFHVGVDWSNSSHGTLLLNSFVIWVAVIAHFVTHDDRLDRLKTVGLFIAAVGVLVVLTLSQHQGDASSDVSETVVAATAMGSASQADLPTWSGDLMLLLSSVLLGVKIVYTKHAYQWIGPTKLVFWHDIVGVALLACWSAVFETVEPTGFTAAAVWGLLYQGVVVAGFCFVMHAKLLERHRASQLSVFSFATPLFGIVAAFLFRGDPMSPWLWVSGLCVGMGIILVNRPPRTVEEPAAEVAEVAK